jgi:hypothetical protein
LEWQKSGNNILGQFLRIAAGVCANLCEALVELIPEFAVRIFDENGALERIEKRGEKKQVNKEVLTIRARHVQSPTLTVPWVLFTMQGGLRSLAGFRFGGI